MREEYVPVSIMRPSQWKVREESMQPLLNSFSPDRFEPVPLVQIGSDFVLCDGHNRAFSVYLTSQAENTDLALRSRIIEDDADIRQYCITMFSELGLAAFVRYYQKMLSCRYAPRDLRNMIWTRYEACDSQVRNYGVTRDGFRIYIESLEARPEEKPHFVGVAPRSSEFGENLRALDSVLQV